MPQIGRDRKQFVETIKALLHKLEKTPRQFASENNLDWRWFRRVPTGELWDDYFPPVISRDEFYKLRAIRQTRATQRGPVGDQVANLFTGILFNARDGQPFQRVVKNVPRLISASFRNGLSDGDTQSIPYAVFEKMFLLFIGQQLKLEDLFGKREPMVDLTESLMAELEEVEGKIAKVAERMIAEPDIGPLFDVLTKLEARKKQIDGLLEEERSKQAAPDVRESLTSLKAYCEMMNAKDKTDVRTKLKQVIRQIVSESYVVIYGQKRSKFKKVWAQVYFKTGGMADFRYITELSDVITVS